MQISVEIIKQNPECLVEARATVKIGDVTSDVVTCPFITSPWSDAVDKAVCVAFADALNKIGYLAHRRDAAIDDWANHCDAAP
jgi:hypothetical protein